MDTGAVPVASTTDALADEFYHVLAPTGVSGYVNRVVDKCIFDGCEIGSTYIENKV